MPIQLKIETNKDIDNKTGQILRKLLQENDQFLFAGETYNITLPDPENKNTHVTYAVQVSDDIYLRKNKKNEDRYVVRTSEKVGEEGAQGVVVREGTQVPQPDGSFKYKSQTRFTKA